MVKDVEFSEEVRTSPSQIVLKVGATLVLVASLLSLAVVYVHLLQQIYQNKIDLETVRQGLDLLDAAHNEVLIQFLNYIIVNLKAQKHLNIYNNRCTTCLVNEKNLVEFK